ncbi:hypothetical protein NPX13_g11313 [Xylaria arbuscula]|uniref:PNPLA domain-containing protein n=1 Tax=Xylaria arbuscula TaxID=114810 RepID=A0A9W8TH35_9PEZI|nr:hypothetical protein NPX13_g11313 [Xylaria arbuscula]
MRSTVVKMAHVFGPIVAVCRMLMEVFYFWYRKLVSRWWTKSRGDELMDTLHNAENYDDWEHAALQLDNLNQLNLWRNNPSSKSYDWSLINNRVNTIQTARKQNDKLSLIELVRSGLVRNLGNITSPKLYNKSFAGTKYLIEEYTALLAGAVGDIVAENSSPPHKKHGYSFSLSTQRKLDFLHDARQAFGRTTLVLQGGAIFGLCHVGVVKALFLRGLLPRIITGTATGALIASLVAIHTDDELPAVLKGDGIDISAFTAHEKLVGSKDGQGPLGNSRWRTLLRRIMRFWNEGYFLDVKVLEDCVKANLGDMTFEEAYHKSKRILNITVATTAQDGIPTLLNYITTPNVLIWTAAVASNASTPTFYGKRQTTVLCKDDKGNIVPWAPADRFRPWTHSLDKGPKSPLARISQLFNVNHFIVSQARPYLIPFLESDMHGPSLYTARHKGAQITGHLFRIIGLEVRHRLRQLDMLGLLPVGIRRFLVDEDVPARAWSWSPPSPPPTSCDS